jgi:membrane protein YqaA with SNARE-associated domain
MIAGIVAFASAVTMSLPLVPVVCALVALQPSRWKAIALWAVLGSAAGATVLTFAFEYMSVSWLNAKIPEVEHSEIWQNLAAWVHRYGWWVLAAASASPTGQVAVLLLFSTLRIPLLDVFIAVALGKLVKYSLFAYVTQLMAGKAKFEELMMKRNTGESSSRE